MTQCLNLPAPSSGGSVCKNSSVLHRHSALDPGSLEDGIAGAPSQHLRYVLSSPPSLGSSPTAWLLSVAHSLDSSILGLNLQMSNVTPGLVCPIGSSFMQSCHHHFPFSAESIIFSPLTPCSRKLLLLSPSSYCLLSDRPINQGVRARNSDFNRKASRQRKWQASVLKNLTQVRVQASFILKGEGV